MATKKQIENTRCTAEGLAEMAELLGYKRSFGQQLTFPNGADASSLLDFLDDNPGACEALVEWVLENGCHADGTDLEEED